MSYFFLYLFQNCLCQLNFAAVFRVNDGRYQNILHVPIFTVPTAFYNSG